MPNGPDFGPLEQMVSSEAPVPEEAPVEGEMSDVEIAMNDFDNLELPPEARVQALALALELVNTEEAI